MSKPPTNHEMLTLILDKLDSLRIAVNNPRPAEIRHVHEAPPKPRSVDLSFRTFDGFQYYNISLTEGDSWEIPAHVMRCAPPPPPKRKWWQRKPADNNGGGAPVVRVIVDRFR